MRNNPLSKIRLKEITSRIGDGLHGTPDYIEQGEIYFVNGVNLQNGKIIITDDTKKISIQEYEDNFIDLNEKTLLMSINGTIGKMAFYNGEQIMLGKSAAYLNFKDDLNVFYYYYFQLKNVNQYLYNVATGSTIKNLGLKTLGETLVPNIEINYAKQIAKVLSDLDAKIEVNNQINAKLEAMAKSLYDYWFVKFDFPFDFAQGKPSLNGKPYKSSGGKMVFNDELKREIPKGWEVKSLVDIANFKNGIACQKYRPVEADKYLNVIKIREMRDGFTSNTERVRDDLSNDIIINDGDILFSWSASLIVQIWAGGKGALNQHIFKVTSDNYPRSLVYFETLEYLKYFQKVAELRKTTMGHITKEHLLASRICVPPENKLDDCLNQTDKILDKIVINKKQNQKLAELRDWLLPMLMNGQVSVGDAKEYVSGDHGELGMVAESGEEV